MSRNRKKNARNNVDVEWPKELTHWEEVLQSTLTKLRKLKKKLEQPAPTEEQPQTAPECKAAAVSARERAKVLVKTGALKIDVSAKAKLAFKRSSAAKKVTSRDSAVTADGLSNSRPSAEQTLPLRGPGRPMFSGFVSGGVQGGERDRENTQHTSAVTPGETQQHVYQRPRFEKLITGPRGGGGDTIRSIPGSQLFARMRGLTDGIMKQTFSHLPGFERYHFVEDKQIGFVTFGSHDEAQAGLDLLSEEIVYVKGSRLYVEFANGNKRPQNTSRNDNYSRAAKIPRVWETPSEDPQLSQIQDARIDEDIPVYGDDPFA